VQSHCLEFPQPARFNWKDGINQRRDQWMPQIQQILKFGLNLATLNQRRERDGFHACQSAIRLSSINSSRITVTPTNDPTFFKVRYIQGEVLKTEQARVRPHHAVEIDSDLRFAEKSPPSKRRTRIGIRKREL
jgi:hypothetical protein